MLIKTIKAYSDKTTKVVYSVDSIRDVEKARADELIKKGFAVKAKANEIEDEATKVETKAEDVKVEETKADAEAEKAEENK